MPAGKLRQRLRFERRGDPASDGAGNFTSGWATIATLAAELAAKRTGAGEEVLAGRLAGRALYTIRVRWSALTATFGPDMRAVDVRDGQVFNIRSALDLEGRRAFVTMDAEAGVET